MDLSGLSAKRAPAGSRTTGRTMVQGIPVEVPVPLPIPTPNPVHGPVPEMGRTDGRCWTQLAARWTQWAL